MVIESLKVFLFKDNLIKRLSADKGNCLMMDRRIVPLAVDIVYFKFFLSNGQKQESARLKVTFK